MINKKRWVFAFVCLALIFTASFISAQFWYDISRGSSDLIRMLQDFFGPIFEALIGVGGGGMYDQYFFARVLFLILIYVMTSIALESIDIFRGKKGIIFIVSAIVAILGARYIGELRVIENMLLPYGAITIAISIVLPFLIYGFFVHKSMSSGLVRRAAWVFFAVIFIGLWWTRRNDPGLAEFRWIYNIGIIAVLAVIAFDSKLHEYFGLIEAAEYKRGVTKRQIADIEEQLSRYANIQNPSATTRQVIRHLEERRDELAKKL